MERNADSALESVTINATKTLVTVTPKARRNNHFSAVYLFMLLITRGNMGSGARTLGGVDPTKVFERLQEVVVVPHRTDA